MKNLQRIKGNQQSKYDEIIEYLKQDNGYWLENDKWDLTEEFFVRKKVYTSRYIDFLSFKNELIKNEIKYYVLFNFKEYHLKKSQLLNISYRLNPMAIFIEKSYKDINSFNMIEDKNALLIKWKSHLLISNINTDNSLNICNSILSSLYDFIKDFYDDREETEKDIWYSKNIRGAKIPASGANNAINNQLNFNNIPVYYGDMVKRYFKTIITKKSWNHCVQITNNLNYFFNKFYSNGYKNGFMENLSRQDIENYLYWLGNDYKDKNPTYRCKFISYIRTFLEYIQMAQYDKAPKKEISFLIFQDDIPKRELNKDEVKKAKFIPEPILKQLDNNIMDLDRPQYISIYILLRETGWRGTDILNLRYHNCLEQIWNNKEQSYNYYLCGEITKTDIALLKIPIRDKVAEMVQKSIDKAKELSTEENNPKKYLFNTYEGKLKGRPLNKASLLITIKRLIEQKEIRNINGELYHFRLHSLRHTRAKEYVEQGMGISIIQQILGHQSIQMTVHYATVSENMLYEKWKNTEDLELFKVNTETNELIEVDTSTDAGENLIRYEYVKKNLDAVRVPFGVCFKASKIPCKQQMNHCLTCASFCTTTENVPEYEEEILKVKTQIEVSDKFGRELWSEKNKQYLNILEKTLGKVKEQKLVHKNGKSREDS
ncbi:tyrosine-type recombinase/integrase [Clostridium sp. CM028]|uniref:tyrosine-type recombinase/integrase n=1 Tax=unclassified Clostridium TaxID=2614128 RepID=UPI001C6EE9C0|nr:MULTISPECIES: tyrosine-type recombinase/integrase [unclassified Clostridium]MBW9147334.1 tyrosine-type recombinase/integrase [Clostridium sp. CM027]MBW9150314.1 tyrosine-type recombinase/integrase [Clostridium sp. CM028]UVE39548.1 tyrosine-type recombinase/integrase [Clostridium sp. CM027]UVE41394.1 tyrosine-type recombinase/integrase [Clostridium sp. CM027]WLC60259.1 tyrosine-type recombinase/integrase [Clostridium sp. CM028]